MFLYKRIQKWQDETFPKSDALSKLKHLKLEIVELEREIKYGKIENQMKELADCFILLIGVAGKLNINIGCAIRQKFKIIKARKWGKPNKDGLYFHTECADEK